MEGHLPRAWKRFRKKRGWKEHAAIAGDLRELLIRLAPLPSDMAEDLADYFLPDVLEEDTVYRAQEMLELLLGQWMPGDSLLSQEDWNFIREQANSWAFEMDMTVVTSIMKVIVSRGIPEY